VKANVVQATKLTVFCDKLIEAGWLAAIIIVPLRFNIYLERVSQMSKVCLLRSIALLMVLAWVIKMVEQQKSAKGQGTGMALVQRVRNFLVSPFVLPTVALVGIYLLTSFTSVWPRVSFWGSYRRFQGTYTMLSYIAIFFLIGQTLRTREQVERLVTVIVLTSLPVSLYGVFQHYGFDPIPWGQDIAGRVVSSVGNAISVGAYLIMVIPLTIRQLWVSFSRFRASHKERAVHLISTVLYLLILAIQLLCILFTQSRGPFLGLVGGLFFFFLLWAIIKGERGLGLTVISLAILLGLFLIVLNLPNTPLPALQKFPFIERLSRIVGGESFQFRAVFWEIAVNMSLAQPVRAILGYGPETLAVAHYPFVLPELMDLAENLRAIDRCHNVTLDALVTTGLVGLFAYLFLFGSAFYYGLKWLGLIPSSRQRKLFIALSVSGGILGLWLPWQLTGTLRFTGLGIPFGMLAALVVYLVVYLFRDQRKEGRGEGIYMLLVSLFSAIAAHFIESQTGIAVTTLQTYFWIYIALLVVVGLSIQGERVLTPLATRASPISRDKRRRKRTGARTAVRGGREFHIPSLSRDPLVSYSLSVGLILIAMSFSLIFHKFDIESDFMTVVLFLLVWLLSGAILIADTVGRVLQRRDEDNWVNSLLAYVLVSLLCWLLIFSFHVIGLPPSQNLANIVVIHYICFGLGILAIAVSLLGNVSLPRHFWHKANGWLYAGLTIVVVLFIITTNLNVVKADIYFKAAKAMVGYENWDLGLALYNRAVELAPGQDRYYLLLGRAYLSMARMTDAGQAEIWFQRAQETFQQGKEISPLDPEHYVNLGELHQHWARATADLGEATEKLELALDYYQQAASMSLTIEQYLEKFIMSVHLDLADVYVDDGRIDDAIREVEAAKDLAPAEEHAGLYDRIAELEARKQ
jgi:O-antigen ligase/tetratricopeptide (TPR) repeat protein